MRKWIVLFFFSLLPGLSPAAEEIYRLDWKTDLALGLAGTGFLGTSMILPDSAAPQGEWNGISLLDRRLAFPRNGFLDDAGTLSACFLLAGPVLTPVLAGKDSSGSWVTYGVMYSQAFLLTMGIKDFLKGRIGRWRPYTYLSPEEDWDSEEYRESFPSGHTAYAFLGATFLSVTLSRECPDNPWRLPLTLGGYALAAAVGALRVAAGEHFVTDVLAGAAVGTFCGWVVPAVHRRNGDAPPVALAAAPGGLGFHLRF